MTTCPPCIRAQQVADHKHYREGCIGCGVRELAHMPQEKRAQALDVLAKVCGEQARDRVIADLRVECARIKKLRGERAKEKS